MNDLKGPVFPDRTADAESAFKELIKGRNEGHVFLQELIRHQRQNLRQSWQIEQERRNYRNLFNLAPVGFLSLNEDNNIVDANIAIALLLVNPRQNLLWTNIGRYICPSDHDQFYGYRKHARVNRKDIFELEMSTALGRPFFARLEAVLTGDRKWLVAVVDVSAQKKEERELIETRDTLEGTCEKLREERDRRIQAEEQLRRFSRKLIEIQERERQRISRELHDQVGQLMTYLGLLLDKARSQLDPGLYSDAKSVAHEVLTQIRELSSDLQPSMLSSVGLIASLKALFDRFHKLTGIQVGFNLSSGCRDLTGNAGVMAYRIIQEALTNIARHACVDTATVSLSSVNGKVLINVEDSGRGFDMGSRFDCAGLTGMKERAQSIGGDLSIVSALGQGTTVIAELPLSEENTAKQEAERD